MKKKSWITRNIFGDVQKKFSLPIQNLSQNRPIKEHFLCDKFEACDAFVRSFHTLNRGKPFLKEAIDLALYVFESEENYLNVAELNQKATITICEIFGMKVKFKLQSEIPNLIGEKENLLINICERLDSKHYLNLENGETIYKKDYFLESGVFLHFMNNDSMRQTLDQEFNVSILSMYARYGINRIVDILNRNSHFD